MIRIILVLLVVTLVSGSCLAQVSANDQILEAWQKRQDHYITGDIQVHAKVYYKKHSIELPIREDLGEKTRRPAQPLEDRTVECNIRVIFDNMQMRLEAHGEGWVGNGFGEQDTLDILTKDRTTSLIRLDDKTYKNGYSVADGSYGAATSSEFRGLSMFFRPLGPGALSLHHPSDFQPNGIPMEVHGHPVQIFTFRLQGGAKQDYWIDPGMSYLVRRSIYTSSTNQVYQYDYFYDEKGGVYPELSRWEERRMNAQRQLLFHGIYTVKQWNVNIEIPEDLFNIQFPVGSHVLDDRFKPNDILIVNEEGQYVAKNHPGLAPFDQPDVQSWWQRHWIKLSISLTLLSIVLMVYLRAQFRK